MCNVFFLRWFNFSVNVLQFLIPLVSALIKAAAVVSLGFVLFVIVILL